MLEKKEEHLNKKIEDELRKAKANAATNKRGRLRRLHRRQRDGDQGESVNKPLLLVACTDSAHSYTQWQRLHCDRRRCTRMSWTVSRGDGSPSNHRCVQRGGPDEIPSLSSALELTEGSLEQVNAIESANMNKETLAAIKQGADVLKSIHGKL